MIDYEMAEKLKEAGLKWEPQIYDFFDSDIGIENVDCISYNNGKPSRINHWNWDSERYHRSRLVWLPRLEQILSEIEKREYKWTINNGEEIFYVVLSIAGMQELFFDSSLEDVAAQALLWVLEQEGKHEDN